MLSRLRYVDLERNRIQTLEPWIFYVGLNGQRLSKAKINLGHNNISSFTNMIGWEAKCGTKLVHFDLSLSYNPIRHLMDILRGWNISISTWLCLNPYVVRAASYITLVGVWLDCDCVDFDLLKLQLSTHSSMLNKVFL